MAVLTCFHRVLMLGFKGCYALNEPARDQLVRVLTERVPPFETDQSRPVLAGISGRSGLADGLRRWPVWHRAVAGSDRRAVVGAEPLA